MKGIARPFPDRGYYMGNPLETGGTSIQGSVAPAIRFLYEKGYFNNKTVLDYGAGKYGRNAEFLREQGLTVYAYDPYNGSSCDGYEIGCVSNSLPKEKFDIGFTSFVLNVVPIEIEKDIIADVEKVCKEVFHTTRNKDIFESIKNAVIRKNKLIMSYIENEYKYPVEDDTAILDLCYFGVQTASGFQRIPETEKLGYKLIKNTSGYKIYQK
ncbi:MAG: hypothetical protein PF569_10375 [Candidatus Woesearchaeota archaeon]|jgi:hypothetical protein|nr:hypothetical protein [Candidatus Woesearchaeota archaeon]